MSRNRDKRPRRKSLRVRLTLLAVVIAAVPLIGAAIAIAVALRAQLMSAAVSEAMTECVMITSRFGEPPEPEINWVTSGGLACGNLAWREKEEGIEKISQSAMPLATTRRPSDLRDSGNDKGVRPGLSLWPLADPSVSNVQLSREVVSLNTSGSNGNNEYTWDTVLGQMGWFHADELIIWSHSLEREQETLNRIVFALAGGVLLIIGLIGGTTWITVGRVIRPVETIRRKVAEITTHNLSDRVPVPRANTEIAQLAATMNDTLTRLEDAVGEQQRFVADASHELRSPIAALRSELEIALAHPDQTRWTSVIIGALDDTKRLQQLATDLLLLTQLDAITPNLDDVVDLNLLAREQGALRRLREHLTLRYDLRPAEVDVQCRPALLGRLIRNLLDNAERHATSSITLLVTNDDTDAVLEVIDDGPGIPPADRKRVFDRFTRLDHARTRDAGGTGLGLAIARQIAVAHCGSLHITDSHQGARFTVRLPLAPHDAATGT